MARRDIGNPYMILHFAAILSIYLMRVRRTDAAHLLYPPSYTPIISSTTYNIALFLSPGHASAKGPVNSSNG
ncbi:hypothetical protein HETIRDRAFT_412525 [Heterobasidion irregulare TC 32-1]|uniref:Uncharacterized protein n=1 Tax=Heterobasidion irregulare (strain TC 32-1) TaxID=747525 RepID=W4JR84_HETIT|nr:uncharacterized protein HETIRDRAFT_412525 [Heterobasidion irregulare TC 32-1]ETW75381.1 hypothetical protein HETIRDRAFT_412525 [Heterobasidion irregulare TC 32-1]